MIILCFTHLPQLIIVILGLPNIVNCAVKQNKSQNVIMLRIENVKYQRLISNRMLITIPLLKNRFLIDSLSDTENCASMSTILTKGCETDEEKLQPFLFCIPLENGLWKEMQIIPQLIVFYPKCDFTI